MNTNEHKEAYKLASDILIEWKNFLGEAHPLILEIYGLCGKLLIHLG